MHQSSTYFGGFPAETGQYCFAEAQINFKLCHVILYWIHGHWICSDSRIITLIYVVYGKNYTTPPRLTYTATFEDEPYM